MASDKVTLHNYYHKEVILPASYASEEGSVQVYVDDVEGDLVLLGGVGLLD